MKHKKDSGTELHDAQLRKAIEQGYKDESDEARTTLYLPLWLRTEVSNINLRTNVSQGRLYTAMVNYGCSVMKPIVESPIKNMYEAYTTLGTSDNMFIMQIMQEMTLNVNGTRGGGRKTLSVPLWCKNFIGGVAGNLRMEFSSVVRLSLYVAIIRYANIEPHNDKTCRAELERFKKTFSDHMFVCSALSDKIQNK